MSGSWRAASCGRRPFADDPHALYAEAQLEKAMSVDAFVQRVVEVDGRGVPCRFFKPEADRGDFFCRLEVDWPEGTKSRRIYGVDEVQALLLAMQTAHADLLAVREHDGRDVSWLGQRRLGFPIADVIPDWDRDGDAGGASQDS
jgi:hypothetical protein